ncbi:MAG: ferredoxin reductase family protein [Neptuniibacter sp.]
MKPIKVVFISFVVLLSVAWLGADAILPEPLTYFSFRSVFVQYSGVIAIAAMSISMILATRPAFIEHYSNGLDKMYRLHKWLGITALTSASLHWWWAKGTKWMVSWGWLERPNRRPKSDETLSSIEQFLRSQRGLAETLGEWTFYAATILILLALIKYFPYHIFRKTHKWLAALYIVLAYHSVILIKIDYWVQPVGWIVAILITAGLLSSILILANRVGQKRKVKGEVQSITYHSGVSSTEGTIKLQNGWQGHKPGQFAFVTSSTTEGPHPYTIASAWDEDDSSLTFIVKELGDWTQQITERIKPGTPVSVEGPYGNFTFEDNCEHQIWIGAGIGITPFIAKMKQLAKQPSPQKINLFHITSDDDPHVMDLLARDAAAAGIQLHLHNSKKSGRLTPDMICAIMPDWDKTSVWYCGRNELGNLLKKNFTSRGLASGRFHQELFQMR